MLLRSAESTGGAVITLDDRDALRLAKTDPATMATGFAKPTYIDEIQRAGDPLVLAIKAVVDRDPLPGRFVLAGLSRFLTVPTLTESLAGRAQIIDIWPLSQGEISGGADALTDALFGPTATLRDRTGPVLSRRDIAERAVVGGFPAVVTMPPAARADWFESYRKTMTLRDLAELRRLRYATDVPRLLNLAASRSAQEVNLASYAQALGLSPDTVGGYLSLLEVIYMHHLLPAWSTGATVRAKHRPKLHFVDTGLLCDIRRLGADRLADPLFAEFGSVLETFVAGEFLKQRSWSEIKPDLFHFRDRDGREVDLVLESRDGLIAAVEVKAAIDLDERSVGGLVHLRDKLGDRFVNGVVLHLGDRPKPLGDRLTAMPIAALWA